MVYMAGIIGSSSGRKQRETPYFMLCTKMNSKCTKDAKVQKKKLLEENLGDHLYNIGVRWKLS